MYCLNDSSELTLNNISKFINDFRINKLPRLIMLGDYYNSKQAISRKTYIDKNKPCDRSCTNYCKNIVENYSGYIAGKPVAYTSDDDITDIQNILKYNDCKAEDTKLLTDALIHGKAFEVTYIDEDKQQRFKYLNPKSCIDIYDCTLNENLLAVIRFWNIDTLDQSKGYYVEVYTEDSIFTYKSMDLNSFNIISEVKHYYKQVPVTVFRLNSEEKSIFEDIITLQDAYNSLLSAEIDDYQSFVDAYMVLKGSGIDTDKDDNGFSDVDRMKENRVLIMDTDATAEYLTKQPNDTQIENMLKRLNDSIHKISASPDFNDDKFMSQSGISMRYKMQSFENISSSIESEMKKALQKRIELICTINNLSADTMIWLDIDIIFTRNLPTDLTETVSIISALRGLVSDETLVSLLPFVDNPAAEIEKAKAEQPSISPFEGVTDEDE